MQIKCKEVPKIEKEYYYVASDGKEFSNRWDCESYERRLGFKGISVIETAIEGLNHYYDDSSMIMYHIMSEEDWNILVERVWFHTQTGIKEYPGPGYYIANFCDGGDGRDWYHIYRVDEYLDNVNEEVERLLRHKSDIESARDEII